MSHTEHQPHDAQASDVAAGSDDTLLTASQVILRLAEREGVDLSALLGAYDARPVTVAASKVGQGTTMRTLDWPGAGSSRFMGPAMAARFFEEFVLYPGLQVRGWDDPTGRLAFTIEGNDVAFELHAPGADLLIRGTPRMIKVAVGATLPESVCAALIGQPLERLVAWPPATGPDYVVMSVAPEGGVQVVTLTTDPIKVAVSAGG